MWTTYLTTEYKNKDSFNNWGNSQTLHIAPLKLGNSRKKWHAHKDGGKVTEVDEQWLKDTFEEKISDFLNSLYEDENVNFKLLVPQENILKNSEDNQRTDVKMKHHDPDDKHFAFSPLYNTFY